MPIHNAMKYLAPLLTILVLGLAGTPGTAVASSSPYRLCHPWTQHLGHSVYHDVKVENTSCRTARGLMAKWTQYSPDDTGWRYIDLAAPWACAVVRRSVTFFCEDEHAYNIHVRFTLGP